MSVLPANLCNVEKTLFPVLYKYVYNNSIAAGTLEQCTSLSKPIQLKWSNLCVGKARTSLDAEEGESAITTPTLQCITII